MAVGQLVDRAHGRTDRGSDRRPAGRAGRRTDGRPAGRAHDGTTGRARGEPPPSASACASVGAPATSRRACTRVVRELQQPGPGGVQQRPHRAVGGDLGDGHERLPARDVLHEPAQRGRDRLDGPASGTWRSIRAPSEPGVLRCHPASWPPVRRRQRRPRRAQPQVAGVEVGRLELVLAEVALAVPPLLGVGELVQHGAQSGQFGVGGEVVLDLDLLVDLSGLG